MKTHADIIAAAAGPHALARLIHCRAGGKLPTVESRVRGWSLAGSIPSEYWPTIADLGLATVEELALAAEARKAPELAAARQDAA